MKLGKGLAVAGIIVERAQRHLVGVVGGAAGRLSAVVAEADAGGGRGRHSPAFE